MSLFQVFSVVETLTAYLRFGRRLRVPSGPLALFSIIIRVSPSELYPYPPLPSFLTHVDSDCATPTNLSDSQAYPVKSSAPAPPKNSGHLRV